MNPPFRSAGFDSLPWRYRVAQRPRYLWIAASAFFAGISLLGLAGFIRDPHETSSLWFMCSALGLAVISPTVGGFTNLRSPRPLTDTRTIIPTPGIWSLHVPMMMVLVGCRMGAYTALGEEGAASFSTFDQVRLPAIAIVCLVLAPLSLIVAGHHRVLEFTLDGLRYERGWFRAFIPWDDIEHLTPTGDANVKHATAVHIPSRRTLRAGVHITLRERSTAEVHRRTMAHRANGRDVVRVDCSSYRVDPNTLINAIYLLADNPAFRPLVHHPVAAELFVGPDWNTRRRMNVGDTWDRNTEQIEPAGCDKGSVAAPTTPEDGPLPWDPASCQFPGAAAQQSSWASRRMPL